MDTGKKEFFGTDLNEFKMVKGSLEVEYPNLLLKTISTTVILNETMNKTTTTI